MKLKKSELVTSIAWFGFWGRLFFSRSRSHDPDLLCCNKVLSFQLFHVFRNIFGHARRRRFLSLPPKNPGGSIPTKNRHFSGSFFNRWGRKGGVADGPKWEEILVQYELKTYKKLSIWHNVTFLYGRIKLSKCIFQSDLIRLGHRVSRIILSTY